MRRRTKKISRLLAATIVSMLLVVAWSASPAPASAGGTSTVTVNSVFGGNFRDDVITLTEAMMLINSDLSHTELDEGECAQVSTTVWLGGACSKLLPSQGPGAGASDTVKFDPDVFSEGAAAIGLGPGSLLPDLDGGNDTIDGSSANVRINGGGIDCFNIRSNGNTIKGLEINFCANAIRDPLGHFGTTIGGNAIEDGNVISGNAARGIVFVGGGNHTIINNRIGTNAAGDAAFPNGSEGIFFNGSSGLLIEDNVVSGNTASGIGLTDSSAVLRGNLVGINATGTGAIPNGSHGIFANQASSIKIGGSTEFDRNVISGNTDTGIRIHTSSSIEILGNYIGTNAEGTSAMPNSAGIHITGGTFNNKIGKAEPSEGNIIAFNTGDGVLVDSNVGSTTGNAIRGNSIHSNGGKGIALVNGGNGDIPPPTITGFGSLSGTSCPFCTVDVYSDNEDEGRIYEGDAIAGQDGSWTFNEPLTGPNVTATVTNPVFNTSEFSAPLAVPEPATPTPSPTPEPTPTPTPGPTPSATPGAGNAVWGDNNCDGSVQPTDALVALQEVAGLPYQQSEPCFELGESVAVAPAGFGVYPWGDADCDGSLAATDALAVLRHVAALPVNQEPGCPEIGDAVLVTPQS